MHCPECNCEMENGSSRCQVCGWETAEGGPTGWAVLGCVEGRAFADLARGALESAGIPAVVISGSGFFGDIGLPLNPVFDPKLSCGFEISVPDAHRSEAAELLDMTIGTKWRRKPD